MSVYFPALLIQATKVAFQGRISGYLLDARPVGAAFKAAMFFDIHQRSENGDTVVTDDLAAIEEEHGYSIALTVRGERYVIVSLLMFMTENIGGAEETVVLSLSRGPQLVS